MVEGVMSDYEVELRGVTLTCDELSVLGVSTLAGFGGGSVSSTMRPYTGRDGSVFQGPDRLRDRRLTFEAVIVEETPAAAELSLRTMIAAWNEPVREGSLDLRVRLAGTDYLLRGRPGTPDANIQDMPFGVVKLRLPFACPDPRMYETTERSATLGLGNAEGGFTAPVTFPYFAVGGSGGDLDPVVSNTGLTTAPWRAELTGPLVNPELTLSTTGEKFSLVGEIPDGSTLALDSLRRTVRLDGSPRPSWPELSAVWWELPVGNSIIRLRAVSGSGGGTFYWRSAWL
jgi:hypothetical protein